MQQPTLGVMAGVVFAVFLGKIWLQDREKICVEPPWVGPTLRPAYTRYGAYAAKAVRAGPGGGHRGQRGTCTHMSVARGAIVQSAILR